MSNNHKQLKCLEDISSASQTYMDQFNELDVKQQGYLDEHESQLYFSSINFGKEFEIIWNSVHDMKDSGRLTSKQFIVIMFIAQYRHEDISIDQGSIYRLTEFSQSLRHSEESLQEIEHYKFLSLVTLVELRTKFSQAFFKFEDMLKQIFNSDTPQETSQIPACNVFEEDQDTIPSPIQKKTMPGSFQDEKKVSKSVPKPNYTSLPQSDPGFLDQSHKEASTLTLRSQFVPFENSYEEHNDSSHEPTESNAEQGGLSIPDVVSNITDGFTGIASLVGLSNSPKPETRGLDTAQETNRDIVEPSQTDATPLPIKPKEIDESIAIDPPVDLNNSGTDKRFTDDELNQGADALKEIGQSIPVTDTPTESFELPSTYITNRLADALNEAECQPANQNNTCSSDSNSLIENSNVDKAIAAEVNELKSAIDTNVTDFTEHMDDTVKARPELVQNEDGSFGYATIIVPGKEISEDMQQGALHLRATKVHTEPQSDIDTPFHTPSNNVSEPQVIDSSFRNTRINPTNSATQTNSGVPDYPAKRSDEIEKLERDIEEQLDILSNSASSDSESSHRQSPAQLQSLIFHDKSTAEAIESLTNSPDNKRVSIDGRDRVLYVRDGFQNFIGFGLKCLSKDRPSSI
ncbi:hypothetical protein EDC94DRAFT_606518 [Helicostylum pulchrum]|nr:hypothetical protein EDC94DRAFT_606518 [Helicostylum pulchrum]